MIHDQTDELAEAFKIVLLAVAQWRRLAATDPEEYARRHKQLVALERAGVGDAGTSTTSAGASYADLTTRAGTSSGPR